MELAAVLESMVDGVFIFDAAGELIVANAAALEHIGAKDVADVRAAWFRVPVICDENGQPIRPECSPVRRALAGEAVVHQLEIVAGDARPRRVLRTRSGPIRDRSGAIIGAVKVATDVTREYDLERLKDDFVRIAAHELRTPVAVIKVNAQATLTKVRDVPAAARRFLDAMVRGADRIDRLVSSLVDLLDLQGGMICLSPRPLQLDELVGAAIAQLPRASAGRIRVIASAPVTTRADEPRLRQVVRVLLDNALKYSPPESTVEVSVARTERAARVMIRDHGFGIPRDKADHVFEKFYRAHAGTVHDAGGIGVGLFVAREIVRQHGGQIWFESIDGDGTVFYVELPV